MRIYSNAPEGYVCPICAGLGNVEGETLIADSDIVYRDDLVVGLINSFMQKGNEGHVIVVPRKHYEAIYDIPESENHAIADAIKLLSIAMKEAYSTNGITIRQNNEPASLQHAFHYHVHIYPRYERDDYESATRDDIYLASPEERKKYSGRIKAVLND